MNLLLSGLLLMIAAQHVFFMLLETYYWTKPLGMKIFRLTPERAQQQKVMASNQGIYNGFLAAGLFWSAVHPVADFSFELMSFFLTCVVIAGVWGGFTVSKRILYIQAGPALFAILLLILI